MLIKGRGKKSVLNRLLSFRRGLLVATRGVAMFYEEVHHDTKMAATTLAVTA